MNLQNVIEATIKESVSKILLYSAESASKLMFTDLTENTKKEMNDLGTKILSFIVSQVEENFEKSRDRHKIVIRNKNKKRRLLTEMGEVEINHTLYCDKASRRYFFAVDEMLQIDKKTRIESGMKAKLISDATITSYGKASELADCAVSRQTVFNLVKKLKNISAPVIQTNLNAENVFIEADEDHIHLNTSRPAEVKLVYVHEGRREENGRETLINPRYFVSAKQRSEEIWNDADEYVNKYYRPYRANVHLSGDGAQWIRQGEKLFPGVEYHLDKFHVLRALTLLSSGNKRLLRLLKDATYSGDEQLFRSLCDDYVLKTRDNDRAIMYITENFPYIDSENTCCAESHVSHVLSSRMSSRPMGWSREGAERIGKLRAFYFNQGNFRKLVESQKTKTQEENQGRVHYNNVLKKDGTLYEPPQAKIATFRASYAEYANTIKNIIENL
ncbi:MAG: ISLre2 family transposase [Clostridia bacterium]|nr:ISLre2 family transposase [Clostridia bacterium]